MSNQGLFNLFSEILKNRDEDIQVLDFTKKEDLDKFKNAIKTIRENPFFGNFFSDNFLNEVLDKAQSKYDKAHEEKKAPQRPSLQCPTSVKENIQRFAKDYVNTMIAPYVKEMDEKQYKEIVDSLYEFGCWIYRK
jgi:hypothetical protein